MDQLYFCFRLGQSYPLFRGYTLHYETNLLKCVRYEGTVAINNYVPFYFILFGIYHGTMTPMYEPYNCLL